MNNLEDRLYLARCSSCKEYVLRFLEELYEEDEKFLLTADEIQMGIEQRYNRHFHISILARTLREMRKSVEVEFSLRKGKKGIFYSYRYLPKKEFSKEEAIVKTIKDLGAQIAYYKIKKTRAEEWRKQEEERIKLLKALGWFG